MSTTSSVFAQLVREKNAVTAEWATALAEERRIHLLRELHDVKVPIEKRELARLVAYREFAGKVDDEDIRAIHISLHHTHLPKLQDLGILSYEDDNGTLTSLEIIDEDLLKRI